jgi:hypothetical protein
LPPIVARQRATVQRFTGTSSCQAPTNGPDWQQVPFLPIATSLAF